MVQSMTSGRPATSRSPFQKLSDDPVDRCSAMAVLYVHSYGQPHVAAQYPAPVLGQLREGLEGS